VDDHQIDNLIRWRRKKFFICVVAAET